MIELDNAFRRAMMQTISGMINCGVSRETLVQMSSLDISRASVISDIEKCSHETVELFYCGVRLIYGKARKNYGNVKESVVETVESIIKDAELSALGAKNEQN